MPRSRRNKPSVERVTRALLLEWPIPKPSADEDKEGRGRVLVIGGEVSLPGAVVLAGIAALRAGAGKLQIATCKSIAPLVGIAVPESLSLGLDETEQGTIAPNTNSQLNELVETANAILIGPGMKGTADEKRFVLSVIESTEVPVVIDAGALDALDESPTSLHRLEGKAVITPHAGEMSRIIGKSEEEVTDKPEDTALTASSTLNSIVVLKGSSTFIASPAGELFCYDAGDVGLATSGSGDTLAGVIAGLIARGATPLHAAIWAVFLHGSAGNRLAKRVGRIGYLARELLDEIPPVMTGL